MGLAAIGDQSVRRQGNFAVPRYFQLMVRPHFYDRHLRILSYFQQSEWHTYVIIQVALGGIGGVFSTEHSGNQFLGRSLSIRPGNSQERYGKLRTMVSCQLL